MVGYPIKKSAKNKRRDGNERSVNGEIHHIFSQVSWWSIASVAMDNGPFLDGLQISNMVIFP
jgi:hypothetical protein